MIAIGVTIALLATAGTATSVSVPSDDRAQPPNVPPVLDGVPPEEAPPSVTFEFPAKGGIPGPPPGKGPGKEEEQGKGYKLFKGGVKILSTPSTFMINPSNDDIDNENLVISGIVEAFEVWDENVGVNIHEYGGRTNTVGSVYNGENGISFVSIDGSGGTVARATIWYTNKGKNVVEYDIVFDLGDNYGVDLDGEENGFTLENAFDLRNVATHEAGHTLVLEDLYEDKYSEMTMYGYTTPGETKKRSLEWGDSDGIHELYG
ncbi:MAG: matrixin family metalloprotease [Candidatus Hadarchaeota archaeon]|nr:matrixin family metalloprotease [Candidatus Hadarchaeota archaeon]